jgi:aspartate racemase
MSAGAVAATGAVGILGGMGPHATVAFLDQLVQLTPAERDSDHLRLVVDSHPHIPSRTRHLLYGEASPVPGMIEACRKLAAYPVDFIAVPCNSACGFIDDVRAAVAVPILDIVEITAQSLVAKHPSVGSCAVIGGHVTYKKQSYRRFLEAAGVDYVEHDEQTQTQIEGLITKIKLLDTGAAVVRSCAEVVDRLRDGYGAESIILGCTEFGCIDLPAPGVPLVDSSYELARHIVEKVKQDA